MSFRGVIKIVVLLVVKETVMISPLLVVILADAPVHNGMLIGKEEKKLTEVNKFP